MTSPDLTQANIDKIAELFPSVVTESSDVDGNPARAVDFDLLRQELSDHIVDGPQERYRLDWPGKRAAAFTANAPIAKTLRPVREESVDFDNSKNLFIEGDNLDALKLLQESYLGKVKLIYIDPPYNTGNDFVYEDDFAESNVDYLERSGQTLASGERLVANPESNGRFHSDWLSMMYPRLRLARNLLSSDGFIFISIDEGEQAALRHICDEVFGTPNYVTTIMWRRKRETSNDSKNVAIQGEYILVYARSAEGALALEPLAEDYVAASYRDPTSEFPEGRWRGVPITVSKGLKGGGYDYSVVTPSGDEISRTWAYPRESFERLASSGRLYWGANGAGVPQRVMYAHESQGQPTTNYWDATGSNKEGKKVILDLFGEAVFDTVKPVSLLQRIIGLASVKDSIVMDFFAGSATTAHAVLVANAIDGGTRRFIVVQLDEVVSQDSTAAQNGYGVVSEISRERIRRAGVKLKSDAGVLQDRIDVGFRALRVDTTNLADTSITADELVQTALLDVVGSVKPDRTGEDLLFQVLLDWGLELTMPIKKETIDGFEVYDVEEGALILCARPREARDLSLSLSLSLSRAAAAIAERQPLRVVFLDEDFADDAERINVGQVFSERSPHTEVKTI
ncbi:MAG TPA: site-specific DNA-methyltransferase [Denitromonas sp.]|nr:site-specific DNA-methyltransferase [Denitromonas sp.]